MPIRSIKLKLKTNSGPESAQLRKGLWRTHVLFNEGIAYYMEWLILIRQEGLFQQYVGYRSKEEITSELLQRLHNRLGTQGIRSDNGSLADALPVLRQLYELIVPSSIGLSGDAQMLARKFLSPLTDPDSEGGLGKSKAGNKPKWKRLQETGDPRWEEEYKKDREKKQKDPTATVLKQLDEFGLKPLIPLYTDQVKDVQWIPKKKKQFVRTWDRDMFQQAIERLLSWESWNRRVAEERAKLLEKKDNFYHRHFADDPEWLMTLREFEAQRDQELDRVAEASANGYKITTGQIRGWERVYEKWSQLTDRSEQQLLVKLAEVQTAMSGGFGDPMVFRFLARPKNHHLWIDHPERLKFFAAYNVITRRFENAKEQATFTLPDPVKHPLWIRFDARGGNIHSYVVQYKGKKNYSVTLEKMLWPGEDGTWIEKEVEVLLAPSRQFLKQVYLSDNEEGKQQIKYRDYSALLPFEGELSGAKIQFDRRYLENRMSRLAEGDIGPVYINIGMDIQPLVQMRNGRPAGSLGKALSYFPKGEFPKVSGYKEQEMACHVLEEGMRVMAVDLGQRTSAAVSVFEVTLNRPENNKLYFPLPNTSLYAVHKRSLLLNLEGEQVMKEIEKARRERKEKRGAVRSYVRLLSSILRLHTKGSKSERIKELNKFVESIENNKWAEQERAKWKSEINVLRPLTALGEEEWKAQLVSIHRKMEPIVGQKVSEWRRSLSEGRIGIAGISMWNLEELEATRKLLVSWSKRSRIPGESNRINRDEKFALHQLTHLQNVKDDRLKKMANLLVMTALGYKYNEATRSWEEVYPPCQLILFEDLSRYLFNMDRSKRENSRLMKWAHRSIPKLTWMQGELFGLQVGDVFSAFSSRYHAKTGAPGIRCHALTEDEVREPNRLMRFVDGRFITENMISKLRAGDLVPDQGGELFVTLADPNGDRLTVIHADINAAQNLQKRFWTKGADWFRVPCQRVKIENAEVYVPTMKKFLDTFGKGSFKNINKSAKEQVYIWENSSKMRITKPSMEDSVVIDSDMEFDQATEEAQEMTGERRTLMRDPSGIVLNSERWYPQNQFWGYVRSRICSQLKKRIESGSVEV